MREGGQLLQQHAARCRDMPTQPPQRQPVDWRATCVMPLSMPSKICQSSPATTSNLQYAVWQLGICGRRWRMGWRSNTAPCDHRCCVQRARTHLCGLQLPRCHQREEAGCGLPFHAAAWLGPSCLRLKASVAGRRKIWVTGRQRLVSVPLFAIQRAAAISIFSRSYVIKSLRPAVCSGRTSTTAGGV